MIHLTRDTAYSTGITRPPVTPYLFKTSLTQGRVRGKAESENQHLHQERQPRGTARDTRRCHRPRLRRPAVQHWTGLFRWTRRLHRQTRCRKSRGLALEHRKFQRLNAILSPSQKAYFSSIIPRLIELELILIFTETRFHSS